MATGKLEEQKLPTLSAFILLKIVCLTLAIRMKGHIEFERGGGGPGGTQKFFAHSMKIPIQRLEHSNGGEHTHSHQAGVSVSEYRSVLIEQEIAPTTAQRWQTIATMEPKVLEQKISSKLKSGGELTTSGMITEAKKIAVEKKRAEIISGAPEAKLFSGFVLDTVSICDIHDLKLPEACADMVFTDPPYDDESLPLFDRLAEFGAEVLKPGTYLMTYTGKMFLPQVMASLSNHLEYVWTFCVYQPDSNHKIQKHHVFQAWRPILCFKKPGPTETREWQPDAMLGTRNKDFHEWQQQIEPPRKYIAAYSPIGGIVIDPFVGSGTTALACKQTGRHYLAFDKDADAVKISLARLQNE